MEDPERLVDAILANDQPRVADLLQAGADPNAKDAWGRPVLYRAIVPEVDLAILECLLANGAEVAAADWSGEPLLRAAARFATPATVERLCDAGAVPDAGALAATILNDQVAVAEVLLRRGLDVDCADPGSGRTTLHGAGELGSRPILELMLARGADVHRVDALGDTLLHVMARVFVVDVHAPLVALALAAGADPEVRNREGRRPGDLLAAAAHAGHFVRPA